MIGTVYLPVHICTSGHKWGYSLIQNFNVVGVYGLVIDPFMVDQDLTNNVYRMFHDYNVMFETNDDNAMQEFIDNYEWMLTKVGAPTDPRKENQKFVNGTSHKLEEMLKKCIWKGQPCDASDFTVISHDMGQCYAFNGNKDHSEFVSVEGKSGGLKLTVDVQQYLYMKSISEGAGLKVIVLDSLDDLGRIQDTGYHVSVGTLTSMAIRKNNYSEVKPPVGNCNETHGINHCLNDCVSRNVLEECGCVSSWMAAIGPMCNFTYAVPCSDRKGNTFLRSDHIEEVCKCLPKCERSEYDVMVSSSKLSQYMLSTLLLENTQPTDLAAIGRLQDWAYLDRKNRSLTDSLFKAGQHFGHAYWGVLKDAMDMMMILDDLSAVLLQSDSLKSYHHVLRNISMTINDTFWVQKRMNQSIVSSFLFPPSFSMPFHHEAGYKSMVRETFHVRCAYDILRHNATHGKQFFQKIMKEIEQFEIQVPDVRSTYQILTEILSLHRDEINMILNYWSMGVYTNITTHNQQIEATNVSTVISYLRNDAGVLEGYSSIKENVAKTFKHFMWVYERVHEDPMLLKTQDWGKVENEQFYEQNYIVFHIYFDSLSTMKIEQFVTDSMTSLICDLGGNIGLWLGGSLLTIVEILDIFLILVNGMTVKREPTSFHKGPLHVSNGIKG